MIHTGIYYEQAFSSTQFFNTFLHFSVKLALAARLSKCKRFFFFHVCAPKGGLAETMETGDTYCNMTSTYLKDVELFRNRSVYKFYCLKVLFTLEQVNTSVVKNKKESL